jgi:hypothetical protein
MALIFFGNPRLRFPVWMNPMNQSLPVIALMTSTLVRTGNAKWISTTTPSHLLTKDSRHESLVFITVCECSAELASPGTPSHEKTDPKDSIRPGRADEELSPDSECVQRTNWDLRFPFIPGGMKETLGQPLAVECQPASLNEEPPLIEPVRSGDSISGRNSMHKIDSRQDDHLSDHRFN